MLLIDHAERYAEQLRKLGKTDEEIKRMVKEYMEGYREILKRNLTGTWKDVHKYDNRHTRTDG